MFIDETSQVKTGLSEAMSGLGEELEEIKEYDPTSSSANNQAPSEGNN